MAHPHQSSIDQVSSLEPNAFKTPSPASSSYCTPDRRRQALASLDPNTPVRPPSSCTATTAKNLQTPRTKSSSNKRKEKHNPHIPSPLPFCSPSSLKIKKLQTPRTKSPSSKKGMLDQDIPNRLPISSPPALERLQHDLTNRRRPFDESEGEEHYARRRANLYRMREYRENARRLSKTIRKARREVEEGIEGVGGRTERIQKSMAGFGPSTS
ncbi:hypothetical protein MMC31_003243 [Peltigera leucophlebia]|nr:hypothetical protein [Peltigera leucophlebia]